MADAIDIQANAFKQLQEGKVTMPLRTNVQTEYGSTLFMPCHLTSSGALGLKIVAIRPQNAKNNLPTIPATILLIDPITGAPLALMDGTDLTSIRTAAASGVATKFLANKEAHKLALFGAGPVARHHVYAMLAVRPSLKDIVIVNRTKSSAEKLASLLRSDTRLSSLKITVSDLPESAVKGADIIVTATSSTKPLFDGHLIKKGAHINCVGSFLPTMQEVDATTIKNALVVVDTKDVALEEAGDLIKPITDKVISAEHILAELGEVVCGKKIRKDTNDITLFKSCGIAVQDVAIAHAIYTKAKEKGLGKTLSHL